VSTYNITIETGNAAFEEDPSSEIRWILYRLAKTLERTYTPPDHANLIDSNGNTCGSATYATT
jgi:hypothetical protein